MSGNCQTESNYHASNQLPAHINIQQQETCTVSFMYPVYWCEGEKIRSIKQPVRTVVMDNIFTSVSKMVTTTVGMEVFECATLQMQVL